MKRQPNQYLATNPPATPRKAIARQAIAHKHTIMRTAITTFLLLATAFTANADTFKATGIGPLKNIVDMGNADGWSGAMKSDVYWLTNKNNEGAIRYYYTPYDQKTNGVRKVELDVTFNGAAKGSRAGLLYGHQTNPRFYYLVVAGPAGQLDVYRRNENGLSLMMGLSGKTHEVRLHAACHRRERQGNFHPRQRPGKTQTGKQHDRQRCHRHRRGRYGSIRVHELSRIVGPT